MKISPLLPLEVLLEEIKFNNKKKLRRKFIVKSQREFNKLINGMNINQPLKNINQIAMKANPAFVQIQALKPAMMKKNCNQMLVKNNKLKITAKQTTIMRQQQRISKTLVRINNNTIIKIIQIILPIIEHLSLINQTISRAISMIFLQMSSLVEMP